MLFSKANKDNVESMKVVLQQFCAYFGHRMNIGKSNFFLEEY